ncbi:MAG: hypothetical protein RSB38_00410 [Oscillospiraceae bacterium]
MNFILIGIVLAMKGVQGYFTKKLSGELTQKVTYVTYLAFNMLLSSLFAGVLLLVGKGNLHIDSMMLWCSIICGISIAVCMVANLMALKEGAIVLVQVFAMAGILVPCISGSFLFGEKVSILQFIGIGILIISTLLLMQYNKSIYGKLTPKTIFLLLITLISNGTTMLAQKMFAFYVPSGNVSMFSFLQFIIPTIVLALLIKPIAKQEGLKVKIPSKNVFIFGSILAVAILTVSQLSTVVSKALPSVLVFPIVNGGGLILTTILAATCFKEKLSVKSSLGLILAIISLVIINF